MILFLRLGTQIFWYIFLWHPKPFTESNAATECSKMGLPVAELTANEEVALQVCNSIKSGQILT